MMKLQKTEILFLCLAIFCSSCVVSSKKYKTLEAKLKDYEFIAQSDIAVLKQHKEELEAKMRIAEATQTQQKADYEDLKSKFDALQKDRANTLAQYDALLEQNKTLLNTASGEKEELSSQLVKQQRELANKEKILKSLEIDLKAKENALKETTSNLGAKEQKIAELQAIVDAQNKKAADLRWKLSQTLKGFSSNDLTVKQQNGKVYVSMSQNLLFATGSDKIDPKGVSALKQLAAVLATNADIDIMVEGHTDNTGTADLNWDLSTNRALAVVKVLTSNKVDGSRITAAGRGMFAPVAPNTDAVGKAQNRRTDIVLSPKLDELYKLLGE